MVTGPAAPPDPNEVLFIDRSLGRRIVADTLRPHAHVEIHDDLFPQDCHDDVWIEAVSRCGWVILTKDKRIRKHGGHLQALTQPTALGSLC